LGVEIELGSWKQPGIFDEIQRRSNLDIREMYRTFNMGIGMAVIVSRKEAEKALSHFKQNGINAWEIGKVIKGKGVQLSEE